jgi:hypothetical protein
METFRSIALICFQIVIPLRIYKHYSSCRVLERWQIILIWLAFIQILNYIVQSLSNFQIVFGNFTAWQSGSIQDIAS